MARRTILVLAVLLVAAAPLAAQEAGIFSDKPKPKSPVPDETTQKEAMRLVGEVYKADYDAAKTPEARQTLARKLLQAAAEATEPANRYVLLKVARDVAAQAADADLAFQTVDALAAAYSVDAAALKLEALETASRAAVSPEQLAAVVEGGLALVDQAAARDDFETTARLGRFTLAAARRTRDTKLVARVVARNRELEKAARAFRKVKTALETLQKSPGDPKANQTVGHYLCLVKGDWDKGLPMLALGSDETLKALAVQELKGAADAPAQATLGDGWWDLAQTEQGPAKARLQDRAKLWYTKALPNLTGLAKAKVQKRLEEEEPAAEGAKKKPEHYLAPENIKNVAFLSLVRSSQSWQKDAGVSLQVEKVPDGYRILCRANPALGTRSIVFYREDVTSKRMIAVVTVEKGDFTVGFRSKSMATGPPICKVPMGQKRAVQLWIQDGVARARLDGAPLRVQRNDPTHYGFFVFGMQSDTSVVIHELRFESLK